MGAPDDFASFFPDADAKVFETRTSEGSFENDPAMLVADNPSGGGVVASGTGDERFLLFGRNESD